MTKSKTIYPATRRAARRLEIVAFRIDEVGWCYGQKLGTDIYAFFDRATPELEPVEKLDDAGVALLAVYVGDGERDGRWSIIGSRKRVASVPEKFTLWSYVFASVKEMVWDFESGKRVRDRPALEEEIETSFSDAIHGAAYVERRLTKMLSGNPGWEDDEHKNQRGRTLSRLRARH